MIVLTTHLTFKLAHESLKLPKGDCNVRQRDVQYVLEQCGHQTVYRWGIVDGCPGVALITARAVVSSCR